MEIILTKQTLSLTGVLARGYGYYLQRRGKRFFAVRMRLNVPHDGHWRFIVLCAELAKNKLYISDIKVTGKEVGDAIYEAGKFCPAYKDKEVFNASRILRIKENLGL